MCGIFLNEEICFNKLNIVIHECRFFSKTSVISKDFSSCSTELALGVEDTSRLITLTLWNNLFCYFLDTVSDWLLNSWMAIKDSRQICNKTQPSTDSEIKQEDHGPQCSPRSPLLQILSFSIPTSKTAFLWYTEKILLCNNFDRLLLKVKGIMTLWNLLHEELYR